MATWWEVMRIEQARALVEPIRSGYSDEQDNWRWVEPTQTAGIRVVVVDDGCHTAHPAFPARAEQYSFLGTSANAPGKSNEDMRHSSSSHGTMSCGMIVGAPASGSDFLGGVVNGFTAIAFCPARYDPRGDFSKDKAMYEKLIRDGAKVVSNSYGCDLTSTQIGTLATVFGGATTFVFAAGNFNTTVPNIEVFKHAILVSSSLAADTPAGESKAQTSSYAGGVTVCAPGGDTDGPISTTNGGNYGAYGQTSAACAMVAGVVALMLLAKPTMTRLNLIEALALSAVKIDPTRSDGEGRWRDQAQSVLNGNQRAALPQTLLTRPYSKFYGFGRVDAEAAVTRAINNY